VLATEASGVLSALGLVVSERRRDLVESVLLAGDDLSRDAVAAVVQRLGDRGRAALTGAAEADAPPPSASAAAGAEIELRATYDLRYAGQAFELSLPGALEPDTADLRAAFDRAHEERYGYADPDAVLELVTVRVAAALPGSEWPSATPRPAERRGTRRALFGGEWTDARILGPGEAEIDGPAVIELPGSTLVVPPGWRATAGPDAVELERT
jgi:N-methylhydantoinase A